MNSITTSGRTLVRDVLINYDKAVLSQKYLTLTDFDDALQDIETGTITLPRFNELSIEKPANGPIDCNNQRLNNVATLDVSSIESILATPQSAVNVNTLSTYTTLQLALNTAYCGPLSSEMSVKNKLITNQAKATAIDIAVDTQLQIDQKLLQGVNYGFMQEQSITLDKRKDNQGVPDPLQLATVLDCYKNTSFGPIPKIIQGVADPQRDFDAVNKRSTIVEEEKQLQYQVAETVVAGPYDHFALSKNSTVYTVSDPKSDPTGLLPNLTIKDSVPTQTVAKNLQIANLKYVDNKTAEECNKRHSKSENVDLISTYRVINMPDPNASHHGVNKSYCDYNSGKDTSGTGGNLFSTLFGAIAGGVAGALTSLATQGLGSALGSIASSGVAAFGSFLSSGLFNGGMRVGSQAGLEALKANNPIQNEGPLIDNLKSDIANRPQGQPDVGSLVSGAMSITGLLRANSNALIGLFDIVV